MEEKKTTEPEVEETSPVQEQTGDPVKKQSKIKKIIIAVLAIILVLTVLGFLVLSGDSRKEDSSLSSLNSEIVIAGNTLKETYEPFIIVDLENKTENIECSLNDSEYVPCKTPVFVPLLGNNGLYVTPKIGENTLSIRVADSNDAVSHTWQQKSILSEGSPQFESGQLIDDQVIPKAVTTGGWKGITRINCLFDHAAYNDPIVNPGQENRAHLHYFYGVKNIDHNTTFQSLYTSEEAGCSGGTLNRSGYWIPALLAPKYNQQTGERAIDSDGNPAWDPVLAKVGEGARDNKAAHELFYYSAGVSDVDSIQVPPTGLKIIAGNKNTTPNTEPQDTSIVRWHCLTWKSSDAEGGPWSSTIPECKAPDMLRMDIFFPSCWDGKNLDSEDHQSHMAYPVGRTGDKVCPDSHPVPIVRISNHFAFPLFPNQLDPETKTSKGFRLASDGYEVDNNGGFSLHGDWWNGWHPEAMQPILDGCIKAEKDCHDGNFATTSEGFEGASWQGSLSLGNLDNAKGTEDIPEIINGGAGAHSR